MKEVSKLIYKFNPNSSYEFAKLTESKSYKLLVMLCNGKEADISDTDKVWLIKKMQKQVYFPCDSHCIMGWRICFKPYLKRFIYRVVGESVFNIIWGIDQKSVEAYLEDYMDELYETTNRGCEQLAEIFELPENTIIR